MTAESSYQDWTARPPAERPLSVQRPKSAVILFAVLKAHGVSKSRFADMLGMNEKAVRKMLKGEASISVDVLGVMPIEMSVDYMHRLVASRGGGPARAAALFKQGLAGLRAAPRAESLQVAKVARRELQDFEDGVAT